MAAKNLRKTWPAKRQSRAPEARVASLGSRRVIAPPLAAWPFRCCAAARPSARSGDDICKIRLSLGRLIGRTGNPGRARAWVAKLRAGQDLEHPAPLLVPAPYRRARSAGPGLSWRWYSRHQTMSRLCPAAAEPSAIGRAARRLHGFITGRRQSGIRPSEARLLACHRRQTQPSAYSNGLE